MGQIDTICSHGASLELHTESLRIKLGLKEDHLSDLLRKNWKFKEELKAVRDEIEISARKSSIRDYEVP